MTSTREEAEAAARALRDAGGVAIAYPGNVTSDDFPRRFIGAGARAIRRRPHPGQQCRLYLEWTVAQDQRRAMGRHPRRASQGAVPHSPRVTRLFGRSGRARNARPACIVHRKVVNVSSVSATGGAAGQANYAAAKAGLHGLTRSLAKEWGPLAVNVNCVAFGYIETRLTQEIAGETVVMIEGVRAARRTDAADDRGDQGAHRARPSRNRR